MKSKSFDEVAYKKVRSTIERFFGWIKVFRRATIRYDRLALISMRFLH